MPSYVQEECSVESWWSMRGSWTGKRRSAAESIVLNLVSSLQWDGLMNMCHCAGEWVMDSEVSSASSKHLL